MEPGARTPICIGAGLFAVLLLIMPSGLSRIHPGAISDPSSIDDTPGVHECRISLVDAVWKGSCGQLSGETPAVTLAPSKKITSGVWRKGSEPKAVWAGKMIYSDASDEIEIEIYDRGSGVLRTTYGWFPISDFIVRANTVQFRFDSSREVPPSDLDSQIVQRAAAILSSEAVWNRADDRKCATTDAKWSIYCAMERAIIEVTGGFHHRRPALQVVRRIVDERTAGKQYHHRLMDYNNDSSTRLEDVHSLFAEALARMRH